MKFSATTLLLFFSSLAQSQDKCPEYYSPRCYCSGPDISKQNCDVTQRITQTAMKNYDICDAYCTDECGEDAGSNFSCHRADEAISVDCDRSDTTCKCSCDHNVTVPSPIPFSSQCIAFCDREDVCGMGGMSYQCGSNAASSNFRMEIIVMTVAAISLLLKFDSSFGIQP